MPQILRNILRRKIRAVLTIAGIVIGVFALTVMGAMAEKLNKLVQGGLDYYENKVTVSEKTGSAFGFGNPISTDKIADIEKIAGVAYVSPSISLLLSDDVGASFGVPPMIVTDDQKAAPLESIKLKATRGRLLDPADRGKTVVGADLVDQLDAAVGKTVKLRERDFAVVGILEKTLTAPDTSALINLADGQELYLKTIPDVYAQSLDATKIATNFAVYLKDPSHGDAIAKEIEEKIPNVKAYGPSFFREQVGQFTKIFNAIILSSALIAIIVGGLSIMNTLIFAVIERTREIGIKKAIGARSSRVLREFLAEALVIGALGGIIGILLGFGTVSAFNAAMEKSGVIIFLITPELLAQIFAFAIAISLIAGFYPAWRASRLNPVEALRYE